MKKLTFILGISAIIAAIVAIIVYWEMFKYGECKKVGHSTTYCVLMINSK